MMQYNFESELSGQLQPHCCGFLITRSATDTYLENLDEILNQPEPVLGAPIGAPDDTVSPNELIQNFKKWHLSTKKQYKQQQQQQQSQRYNVRRHHSAPLVLCLKKCQDRLIDQMERSQSQQIEKQAQKLHA
eukprot:TRINITY_DN2371_c0_g2_i2.p4 TRINITY_DN2371_c0_g2~~TRINITY_DN2371_c0_g2_i2.p4  ORF type:complete len:132 (+),score=18.08 TRINITY_DN2371_c0_g2_i2:243-638(+)